MSVLFNKERSIDEYLDGDWSSEDPFTDRKESDVFAPFEGEVENGITASLNEVFPPGYNGLLGSTVPLIHPADVSCNRKLGRKRCTNASISTSSSLSLKGDSIASRRKKKPKGMPKRPLSAYNLYFQAERSTILARQEQTGGPRIGFEGLGKIIGKQWKDLSNAEKKMHEHMAEKDGERYRKEMEAYNDMKSKKILEQEQRECATPSYSTFCTSQKIISATESNSGPVPFHRSHSSHLDGTDGEIRQFACQSPRLILMSMPPHPSEQHLQGPTTSFAPDGFPPGSHFSGMNTNGSVAVHPRSSIGLPGQAVHDSLSRHDFPPSESLPSSFITGPEGRYPSGGTEGRNSNAGSNNLPMPPGMEIVLSDRNGVDRKYKVQYTCYTMSREAAHKYLESVTGAKGQGSSIPERSEGSVPNEIPTPHVAQTVHGMAPPSLGLNPPYGVGWTT
jgi:hypothetical protein